MRAVARCPRLGPGVGPHVFLLWLGFPCNPLLLGLVNVLYNLGCSPFYQQCLIGNFLSGGSITPTKYCW